MKYAATSEIKKYLPQDAFDVRPLEYEWAEATNAIVFASTLAFPTFRRWESELSKFYRTLIGNNRAVSVESHPDLGCISFWINTDPSVDVHVARLKCAESVENLNSWVGSSLIDSLATDDRAATVGLIRIRPE
ncbi:hypothetical protein [Aureliella helgolandensis]|uniref:Uncharacterized protein n=1 Tax=Aureliella helgolandensis TaxID=2527968 RepID=A0A518GBL3_9BACT|nr:hypothetical protein [Aureliella helgolandensis]QDV25920.1 hypothetical protein Q31a_42870 [Aureliella helgolandensis]